MNTPDATFFVGKGSSRFLWSIGYATVQSESVGRSELPSVMRKSRG